MTDQLSINFGDPEDMRAKLPRAKEILERKKLAALSAQQEVARWEALIQVLGTAAIDAAEVGDSGPAASDASAPSVQPPDRPSVEGTGERDHLRLVVGVLEREKRPMRSREIADILRSDGIDVENSEVSNALYYAANRATPPRARKMPERGVYAPLDPNNRPLTDYSVAAQHGMPVPDRLPVNDDAEAP